MSFGLYESYKREWVYRNPNATPQQYERAMRAIIRKLGI